MGNHSSLVKGLIHSGLIFSLTFGTFSLSIQSASAAGSAHQGDQGEDKAFRQIVTRVANTTVELNDNDIPAIEKLQEARFFEVGLAAIIRLDEVLLNFDIEKNEEVRGRVGAAVIKLIAAQATSEHNPYLDDLRGRLDEKINQYQKLISSREVKIVELSARLEQVSTGAKAELQANIYRMKREIELYKDYEVRMREIKKFVVEVQSENQRVGDDSSPKLRTSLAVIDQWLEHYNKHGHEEGLTVQNDLQKNYLEDVERIEDYMKARVIDQDKAIDAFASIEVEKHVKGYTREKPVIRYLMGLPGTGKDTIVETYVDAIHNKKKAYIEHMFRFPTVREEKDVWSVVGSGKGYVGSEEITDFVKFIVNHSGGRYIIERNKSITGKIESRVVENPMWEGKNLPGYNAPEDAVIFVNEGHNWSSQAKDALLKQAIEKGYYKTNGVNGGVEALYSPITIVFATNEGIELLASRDENGRQNGKNKTDEELLEAYNIYEGDKATLRNSLMAKNGQPAGNHETLGMSEEFNNRIKDEEIILLRPLSAEGKRKIVKLKLNEIAENVSKNAGGFGKLKLSATQELVNFTQEYRDNPEAGARPIDGKLDAIMNEVYAAIKDKQISYKTATDITLDIEKNSDKTVNLVFKNADLKNILFKRVLGFTERDRQVEKMNYDEFDKLAQLPEKLNQKIYGNKEAMDKIGKAVAITQQARQAYQNNREEHKKATSFGLFGYAGLGKTQTAKELTRELTGKDDYLMIDFTNIKTQQDIEKALIGQKNGSRVIPSEFMKAYDKKAGGTLVVLLEELSNTHPDLLKSLYPFLDETEVRNFADGKPRPMSNVIFLVTGNAGLEVYDDILKLDLPRDVKMQAMSWVYESFIKDSRAQMASLGKTMPIPLMTRFTDIFHFRPVNYEILRGLSQRGLSAGLKNLKSKDGMIGWNIGFRNEADYYKTLEIIEREGFEFENQGRSIVNYTKRVLDTDLKFLLSKNHVPEGAAVTLVPRDDQTDEIIKKQGGKVHMDVLVEGHSKPLTFEMEAQKREKEPRENKDTQKRTAVHEAGHNIAMRILLHDKMNVEFLSIVPGVTKIMDKYVFYLGVAKFSNAEQMEMTRQAVIEKIAVNAAGAAAQRLVTKGAVDDAGKSNDNEQSTYLARKAVMEWGLSDKFNQHINYNDPKDLQLLSESDKTIISQEVTKLISEGNELAERLLKANPALLEALSNTLLKKGEMDKDDLDKFYEENKDKIVSIHGEQAAPEAQGTWGRLMAKAASMLPSKKSHNPEFVEGIQLTDDIANIENTVEKEKELQLARVAKPEISIIGQSVSESAAATSSQHVEFKLSANHNSKVMTCSALFN